jgi:hypothetical protein
MVTIPCKFRCCSRTFAPLVLAYARTIHKFQGLSAGPVDIGKIPNMYEAIVADPDDNQSEGNNIGLLYTALSRATTLGDADGRNSAIYFHSADFIPERISNLTKKAGTEKEFEYIKKRNLWVEHIRENTASTTEHLRTFLTSDYLWYLSWVQTNTFSELALLERLQQYKQSRHLRKRKRKRTL